VTGRRRRRASGEGGSIAVELVASVPILVALTMAMVQGLYAVTGVEAATRAARDAARAASSQQVTPYGAARAALPAWVELQDVSVGSPAGCAGACSSVRVRIPFGLPGVITAGAFTVTRHADLPEVGPWD
jgi:hypothetical protein